MLETTEELTLRKDGLALCPDDAPFTTVELQGAEILPVGTLCMYIRHGREDPRYVLAMKDMVGRAMMIQERYLRLVSSAEDVEAQ
jgi:hypothetical protein